MGARRARVCAVCLAFLHCLCIDHHSRLFLVFSRMQQQPSHNLQVASLRRRASFVVVSRPLRRLFSLTHSLPRSLSSLTVPQPRDTARTARPKASDAALGQHTSTHRIIRSIARRSSVDTPVKGQAVPLAPASPHPRVAAGASSMRPRLQSCRRPPAHPFPASPSLRQPANAT